jgi:ribosomal protein L7/L12
MNSWLTGLVLGCLGVGVIAILASMASQRSASQERRLARIERQLGLVMERLDIEESDLPMPEVIEQLDQGNKIKAIKLYREQTGAGLAEAKSAVETLAKERGL